jgi:hypothetical protein
METGRHHDNWRFPRRLADTTPVIMVSATLRWNLQLSWYLPVSVGTPSYRGVCQSPWEPPVIVVSTILRGNLQL